MIDYSFDEKLPERRDLNSKNCERWRSRGVSASRSSSKCERCPPLKFDVNDHWSSLFDGSHLYHYHQHHQAFLKVWTKPSPGRWHDHYPHHHIIIITITITGNHMDFTIIQRCANLDFSLCPMPAPWPTLVARACVVTRNILVEYFCCGKIFWHLQMFKDKNISTITNVLTEKYFCRDCGLNWTVRLNKISPV